MYRTLNSDIKNVKFWETGEKFLLMKEGFLQNLQIINYFTKSIFLIFLKRNWVIFFLYFEIESANVTQNSRKALFGSKQNKNIILHNFFKVFFFGNGILTN